MPSKRLKYSDYFDKITGGDTFATIAPTDVPELFRTVQAETSQWVPSSWIRDNRRKFRLRANEDVSNSKFHALNEQFWI